MPASRQRTNKRFTERERAEAFKRHKRGERLTDIGRALRRAPGVILNLLRRYGGIAPCQRKRAERALTLADREEISRGLKAGESLRTIAERLRRAPSTI